MISFVLYKKLLFTITLVLGCFIANIQESMDGCKNKESRKYIRLKSIRNLFINIILQSWFMFAIFMIWI